MSFAEWVENKKQPSSFSEWVSRKNASSVNADYMNTFISDYNNFLTSAEKDYENINFGNASSFSQNYIATANDLRRRASHIKDYLDINKNSLTEENYNKILSVANLGENVSKITDSFKKNEEFFSQFESENEYNDAVKVNELYNLSSEEIEKQMGVASADTQAQIDSLTAERDELKRKIIYYNRGDKSKFSSAKEKNTAQEKVNRLNEQINKLKNNESIAYTTTSGQNITWQKLYDTKKAEEEFNALYSELSSKEDWEKYVQKGANIENPDYYDAQGKFNTFGGLLRLGEEKVGNIVTFSRENYDELRYRQEGLRYDEVGDFKYMFMTDKEVEIYNYYLAKHGEKKAEEYLDSIYELLNQRYESEYIDKMASFAEEHPIIASITSPVLTLASGAEYIFDAGESLIKGEGVDTNVHAAAKNTIHSTVSEKVDWEIGDWDAFDFIYGTGMSAIDSAVSMAMLGNLGGVALGLSAAADSTNDALNRGMSKGQAFVSGLASGIFEGVFESWQIGAFSDLTKNLTKADFVNLAKYIGKNMWNNAKEETLTEIANIAYDTLVNGEFSQYETAIRQYMNNGMSEHDAKLKVALELGAQVAESGASGALMGFGFGTVGSVVTKAKQSKSNTHKNDVPLNTNAVTNPIESYPVEKQSAIKSFINAVDENIKSFVQRVKSGDLSVHREKISDVSSRAAADIKKLLGIDTQGYTHNINTNGIQHILKRHGANGQHDTTMSSDDDIARVGWVLENYDSVEILTKDGQQVYSSEFIDSDGKPAAQIMFTKKINGTYYVVEAAFENERNKLWVQSTYLTKNKEDVTQTASANNDRDTNARSASASPSSNNTVPRNTGIVNNNISKNGVDNTDGSDSQLTADDTVGEKLETMSFDNDEAGVGEPLSHEQKVILNARGEDHTLTNKQRSLNRIAEKLGVKLVWDIDGDPAEYGNGYYENGIIHMNKQAKAKATVFAHEYIHHIEQSKLWPAFKKFIEGTDTYKSWITLRGNNSDVEQATKNYKARLETNYKKAGKELADSDIIANFMAERFFGGDFEGNVEAEAGAESLLREFAKNDKWYHNIIRFARQMISKFKGDKIQQEFYKMEGILLKARKEVQKNTPTNTGGRKYSIINLDTGKSYVQATRQVIHGNNVAEWRSQISKFFNKSLENGPIKIETIEGDTLTISKETANKARSKTVTEDGVVRELTDKEFLVKLNAESHIDELAEISRKNKGAVVPDSKKHSFAKDGFTYRTVYFQDFDNSYYRITLSVGENNGISTVYNVGKIKVDDIPDGNIISTIGSKADMSSTNSSLSQKPPTVNTNYMQNGVKNAENHSKNSVTPASEADTIARLAAEGRADEYKTDKTVSKLDAEKVADRWIKENKSSFDKAELTANINRMIELSNSSAWGDVINLAEQTAKKLSENSERKRGAASLNDLTMGIFSEIVNNRESVRLSDLSQLEAENAQYRRKLSNAESDIKRKNEQLNKQRQDVKREVEMERAEYADRVKNRERIRRTVRSLDSKLRTNSNVKHVPEELQSAVRDFCGLFLVNDKATFKRKDLADLYVAYSALGDSDGSAETAGGYSEYIQEMIKTAASILDGKSLPQLNDSDLVMLRDITENLLHIVNNENEMFINGRKSTLEKVGTAALNELQDKQSKKDIRLPGGDKVNGTKDEAVRFFGTGNLKPIYFFEQLGGTFKKMFNDMLDGQYECVRRLETAQTFAQQTLKDSNYWKWIDEAPTEIKLEQGGRIKLTKGQAMALYATWKREQTNATQKAQHLYLGGIVLNDKQVTKKLNKNGKEGLINWQEWVTKAHKLTPNDMKIVIDSLSSEQIDFVDTMISYLSDDMAALGNTVSMELYGIKRFKEDYYFPYKTAENFRPNEANGKKKETKLKNSSFTKQTVEKANTPIVVEDFLETWAKHVSEMCQYSTMTLPIENMSRVFGFRKAPDDNFTAQAVRAEIQRVAGKEGVQYVQQLIDDLNGGLVSLPGDKWYQIAVSKFKKNAVFASASVVVQQPSAVCRAFSVISPKYFVKTTFKIAERNYAELKKYCPVAVLKEAGRFDVGTGSQFADWLVRRSYENIKEKGKAFFTDTEFRDDKLSGAAAKADEITWAHIWAAAKAQTAATQNIKVGSEEFYQAAAKLFNEAIEKTQVYDSVLTRSENMRSKSSFTQMTTAFMAEPTTTLNMLWDATNKVKNHNVKAAGKIVGSVICSILLNAILKSFVTAARDDDEEKSYSEKYLQEVIANFTGDVGIWTMIPVIKDVASIFEGYTVDRNDVSLVEDLVKGIKTLSSDNYTDWDKFKSVIGPLAAFFGLPVKNVIRDTEAAWNMVVSFIEGRIFASGTEIKYAALGALPWGDDSSSHYYELLYEAQHNGDEKRYQEVYKYLISKGKDESDIRNGIRKFYRESKEIQRQMESYEEKIVRMTYYNKLEEDKKKNVLTRIRTYLVDKAISHDTGEELSDASKKAAAAEEKGANAAVYMLASAGFEDTDNSGGISKAEKIAAINKMDISQTEKIILISMYTDTSKKNSNK